MGFERWILVGAIAADTTGCRQVLGLDDLSCETSFEAPLEYATIDSPADWMFTRLNGDDHLDLLVVNGSKGSVLLGAADGSFAAPAEVTLVDGMGPINPGDVTGDGRDDLLVVRANANFDVYISSFPSNGDGTFGGIRDSAVSEAPGRIATGDLDRNGNIDLVISQPNTNTIGVYMGRGDGMFDFLARYPSGEINGLFVVDADRDGKLDVISAAVGKGTTFSFLRGKGTGAFDAKVDSPTVPTIRSFLVGDVDGDGNLDVVIGSVASGTNTTEAQVMLGNGDGTFRAGSQVSGNGTPSALADLDSDGDADLVFAGLTAVVSVVLGNGDGTFAPPLAFPTKARAIAVHAARLGSNARADLITLESATPRVSVLRGTCAYGALVDAGVGD